MTQTEEALSLPASLPEQTWKRVLYGLVVTILPVLCFSMAVLIEPDWQSGDLKDYVALVLSPEASLGFLILLAYSVFCYVLLLISPSNYSRNAVIRLGVYTGVLLAFQYCVLIFLWSKDDLLNFCVVWLVWLVVPRIFHWALGKWGRRNTILTVAGLFLVIYILMGFQMSSGPFGPLIFVLIFIMLLAPFWGLLLAGQTAIWLYQKFDSSNWDMKRILGVSTWLVAYTAAWRYDILKMFELYSALPTYPPCYIATAAARGHPRFVRSRELKLADGQFMWVNAQLQRLKFAELVLKATLPRFHKVLRRVYDVLGKTLARGIQHPILADVAYLLLKPFEWMSIYVLSILMHEADQMAGKIYIDHRNK